MPRTRKEPEEVVEPGPQLGDEERLELVFDYLGGLSNDDRSFDARYLEDEISATARRVETLLLRLRDLHRQERLLRMSAPAAGRARSDVTEGEALAVVGAMREEAKAKAEVLREEVKDLQWRHGRDLARLEVLRSWWRQAAEDVVVLEEPDDVDTRTDG
jgi:hypothetical protein